MSEESLSLLESILDSSRQLNGDLERLQKLEPENGELLEAIALSEENAALLERIREAAEGQADVLELPY